MHVPEINYHDISIKEYSEQWVQQLDRGGLFRISSKVNQWIVLTHITDRPKFYMYNLVGSTLDGTDRNCDQKTSQHAQYKLLRVIFTT